MEKKIEKIFFSKKDELEEKIDIKFYLAKSESFFPIVENDFVFSIKEKDFDYFKKKILFFEK